ncbi:MAG: hypothetical protein RLY78_560 [Pseudomonadota bacterium]|jgi:cell division protein FtsI (penicillin-binding protein 3)
MNDRRQARAAGSVRGVNYAQSPLLASPTPAWRSRFVVALVGLGFVGLLGRAAWIQVVRPDFFQQEGAKRIEARLESPATRGRILDRSGVMLATSVQVPSIWANPKDLRATPQQLRQLARLLGLDAQELGERLGNRKIGFTWLRRHVEPELWDQVKALGIKGIYQTAEYRRRYPEGRAAAHVVGFTNLDDEGQEGVERAFQNALEGRTGRYKVVRDRLGRVIDDVGVGVDTVDGQDVQLSIDAKVQYIAFERVREAVEQHKAKAGSAVVLDAQSGEILALANWPSYDPADRSRLSGEQLRNRALTDTFEPGSTVKPLIMAWALETRRVKPEQVIVTRPGSLVVGGFAIRDAHGHDSLTAREVIQKSSNVGIARVAMGMPPQEMWELYSSLGYGQRPQMEFPGVAGGRLRPFKSWRPIEQATMSYGYGLSASLLQMARSYTAIARDGEIIPVTMLKRSEPVTGTRVFSPATAQEVRHMLQMAAGPGGTGTKAQTIGYSVGGKSGTAHKQMGHQYASNKYRSWFVGMAPIERPRVIVAVMVDEPSAGVYFGGEVAAPVFSTIVQQTLRMMNVPPDLDVRSQLVARAAPQPVAAEETVQ